MKSKMLVFFMVSAALGVCATSKAASPDDDFKLIQTRLRSSNRVVVRLSYENPPKSTYWTLPYDGRMGFAFWWSRGEDVSYIQTSRGRYNTKYHSFHTKLSDKEAQLDESWSKPIDALLKEFRDGFASCESETGQTNPTGGWTERNMSFTQLSCPGVTAQGLGTFTLSHVNRGSGPRLQWLMIQTLVGQIVMPFRSVDLDVESSSGLEGEDWGSLPRSRNTQTFLF